MKKIGRKIGDFGAGAYSNKRGRPYSRHTRYDSRGIDYMINACVTNQDATHTEELFQPLDTPSRLSFEDLESLGHYSGD